MKHSVSIKTNQAGVGLLEALVAVALSAIVILGAVYSTSKIMVSQRENNLHYIVVNDLSSQMQAASVADKKSWCDRTVVPKIPLPKITLPDSTEKDITVSCPDVNVTVEDTNRTGTSIGTPIIPTETFPEKQPMVFTVNVPALGGDVTVGETL